MSKATSRGRAERRREQRRVAKRRYHTPTGPSDTVVDKDVHRMAHAFVWGINHLTPAREAELDLLFAKMDEGVPQTDKSVCEPDPEIIAAMEVTEQDWTLDQPPQEAYVYD